ncbi:MAG: NrsF family protein [Bryobacteraceae bacterium]
MNHRPGDDGQFDRLWEEAGHSDAPESLVAAISSRLCSGLRAVAPAPSPANMAVRLFLLIVLVTLAVTSLMGLSGAVRMTTLQRLLVSIALASGAALLALSLSWQMIPGSLQRFSPVAALALTLAGFLAAVALLFPLRHSADDLASGLECTRGGVAIAFPAAFLIWLLVRRGASQAYPLVGATIGGASGLVSVAVLQFHCEKQEMVHLSLWHGCVVILCGLTGFAAGTAFREWRLRTAR